jgi:hypothetical protein
MNQQEIIERDVRLLIGDLHLQLIMARARIAELEQAPVDRPNGTGNTEDHQRAQKEAAGLQ